MCNLGKEDFWEKEIIVFSLYRISSYSKYEFIFLTLKLKKFKGKYNFNKYKSYNKNSELYEFLIYEINLNFTQNSKQVWTDNKIFSIHNGIF